MSLNSVTNDLLLKYDENFNELYDKILSLNTSITNKEEILVKERLEMKIKDINIHHKMHNKIFALIKKKTSINDLLIISDFGHGFINDNILKVIDNAKIFKSINVQSNSSNLGFNFISKYKKYDHAVLDEREMRLAVSNNKLPLNNLIYYALRKRIIKSPFSLTLGEAGGFYISKKNKIFRSPIFFEEPLDTMGSGDAYFVISTLLTKIKCPEILIPFLSNCYAGLKTRMVGNSSVKMSDLIKTISSILA
jgi:bifunctional ADP-heptose synthase (sugar kinase/adenylyltransferase)